METFHTFHTYKDYSCSFSNISLYQGRTGGGDWNPFFGNFLENDFWIPPPPINFVHGS